MLVLKGILYQSGHIDFLFEENQWAFKRLTSAMKDGQENHIVVRPDIATLELHRSPNVSEEEARWLPQLEEFLNSAELVYLQKVEDRLRFRRAKHAVKKDQQLITLASQQEVDLFAKKFWKRIGRFYAVRRDGFRFDIAKLVTMRANEDSRPERFELATRVTTLEGMHWPLATFDATGSAVDTRLISWRREFEDGVYARYLDEAVQIQLVLTQVKTPIVFLHEFRRDFDNYGFEFSEDVVRPLMDRAIRRMKKAKAQS